MMDFDIDDLSDKTYKAIIEEAERFHPDLTLQFGLLSDQCSDEVMFIKMSEKLVHEMLTYEETDLYDIFFDNHPKKKRFHTALRKILAIFRNCKVSPDLWMK